MAYNPYIPQYQNYQPPQTGLIWVQGESGAKSYFVPANGTVLLMDSETDQFFIKSSDASGMPLPLRRFSYKEVTATQTVTSVQKESAYATKDDVEALRKELEELRKETEAHG